MDLVIDLRNGSCSAGLLIEENGKPRWIPQLLQTFIDTEGIHKSVEEADLACYKKGKGWIPIQRVGLSNMEKNKLSDTYIFDLLSEDKDRIKKPLFQILGAMLKEVLGERRKDNLLFLVDRDGLDDSLKEFSETNKRKYAIIIEPRNIGEIQAYALWDVKKGIPPKEGDSVQCKYSDSQKEQAFVWKDNKFEKAPSKKRNSIETDMKPEHLEKVGIVFFERHWGQQWKESQLKQVQSQIFEWREKVKDAASVLEKLKQISFSGTLQEAYRS